MRVNRGEQINEEEEAQAREAQAREAKARKELADAVRLAAELRVLNQTSLTELARSWAVKLFNTSSMSGPEFEGWKAEGLDLFGDPGGEAADIAREVGTKPRDGYVTVRGDGKIIGRHRGDAFVFTAHPTLPWVDSVNSVEFSGLADAIEVDDGDAGFGTGDDPEPVDDDPSGFLEGMSRTAQSGGAIDPTKIPSETEVKDRILKRAQRVNLSERTLGDLDANAEIIGTILATTDRQIKRGVAFSLPKVATPHFHPDNVVPPDPATFNDDLSVSPAPAVPPTPTPKPVPPSDYNDDLSAPPAKRRRSTSRETWGEARERLSRESESKFGIPKFLGDAWKGFESYPQGIAAAYFQMAAYHGLIDDGNKAMAQIRHSLFGQATWELIHADNLGRCAISLLPDLNAWKLSGRAAGGLFTNRALFRRLGAKAKRVGGLSSAALAGYGSAILARIIHHG